VAEHKRVHVDDASASSLARFVRRQVAPLSKAFAESPLMQLRVRTPQGTVTLTKAQPQGRPSLTVTAYGEGAAASAGDASENARQNQSRSSPRIHNGEVGRAYDTINAEVVGIFRDVAQPPTTGDQLAAGQTIGEIEALRLRNAVRCPLECTLIAQVVVDGQPVDFGEALFVVDSGGVPLQTAAQAPGEEQPPEVIEPPRI
jgi:acetyl-CoA carboxylase biotin carboxyl carrier protein